MYLLTFVLSTLLKSSYPILPCIDLFPCSDICSLLTCTQTAQLSKHTECYIVGAGNKLWIRLSYILSPSATSGPLKLGVLMPKFSEDDHHIHQINVKDLFNQSMQKSLLMAVKPPSDKHYKMARFDVTMVVRNALRSASHRMLWR